MPEAQTSPILRDMRSTFRGYSGIQASEEFTRLAAEGELNDWAGFLDDADYASNYDRTFGVLTTTFFCVMFSKAQCTEWLTDLAGKLMSGSDKDFLLNEYLPQISTATEHI